MTHFMKGSWNVIKENDVKEDIFTFVDPVWHSVINGTENARGRYLIIHRNFRFRPIVDIILTNED